MVGKVLLESHVSHVLLGGRSDRHFLADACPVYHNSSRKECKDMRAELNKKVRLNVRHIVHIFHTFCHFSMNIFFF